MEKCAQKQNKVQSDRVKWFRTAMILSVMFFHCLGWYSFYSTVLDFIELLNAGVHTPSIGLSVRCIGCCIGCLTSAFIYKLGDKLMICSIFLIFEGIATGFISNFTCIHVYYFFKFMIGVTAGSVKTGCILVLSDLWKEKSSPLIQTLDFVDLIAAVISPITLQPFLSKVTTTNSSIEFKNDSEIIRNVNESNELMVTEIKQESNIWLPLATFGLLMNITAMIALIMYCFPQKETKNESNQNEEKKEEQEKSDASVETKKDKKEHKYTVFVTAALCFAVLIYNIEIFSFFQLWTTFVMNAEMGIGKSTAVFMLSAFSLAMAVGSIIAIILSIRVKSSKIAMGLLALRIIGNIAIVFKDVTLLWVGGILMSVGFGPFNATLINCLKERIYVSNTVGGMVTFSQFISAAAAVTVLIGYCMENSPYVLIYCNFGVISVLTVILVIVSMLDQWRNTKKEGNTKI